MRLTQRFWRVQTTSSLRWSHHNRLAGKMGDGDCNLGPFRRMGQLLSLTRTTPQFDPHPITPPLKLRDVKRILAVSVSEPWVLCWMLTILDYPSRIQTPQIGSKLYRVDGKKRFLKEAHRCSKPIRTYGSNVWVKYY